MGLACGWGRQATTKKENGGSFHSRFLIDIMHRRPDIGLCIAREQANLFTSRPKLSAGTHMASAD
jgi:hypothetical protein